MRARVLLSLGPPVGGSHHHFLSFPPKNIPARARSRPQPAMDDAIDLDAAAGLASLTSSGAAAPSEKGKPRALRKTAAATKPKKALTPEHRARESAKRKGRRHAADARDEAAAQDRKSVV